MGEQFNKTLSNFVKDFACRNEVIAKFKNRKPISEIVKELTFPISEESVVIKSIIKCRFRLKNLCRFWLTV